MRQIVRLLEALGSDRHACRFLFELEFSALPLIAVTKIPCLQQNRVDEQRYLFSVNADQEAAFRAFEADLHSRLKPMLLRFTKPSEIKRGFKDGSLERY